VYDQTVLPGEVIVVDDGSTDDTPSVVRQFEGRPGFRSFHKQRGGVASARNSGVERANGEYIAFLDHDDLWRPQKLELQLAGFDPGWGMSFTAYERVTDTTAELVLREGWTEDPKTVIRRLEHGPCVGPPSTAIICRDVLRSVGLFEEGVGWCDDWLLWLRIAAAGHLIGYLPEPLTQYRWHGNNLSDDEPGFFDGACGVFDRYGDRRLRAWWRLNAAVHAHENRDLRRARRRLLEAARIRPRAVRPGWLKLIV
jgi:glycosyltransferase involved in cell wall biosynthesis